MATSIATNAPAPPESASIHDRFNKLADALTRTLGSLPALMASILLVVVWALTGPLFNFSNTWQLFINTTTTVVTFWMVFVIPEQRQPLVEGHPAEARRDHSLDN